MKKKSFANAVSLTDVEEPEDNAFIPYATATQEHSAADSPAQHKVDLVSADREAVRKIPIAKIKPSRYQPRRFFSESSMMVLAESIKEKGVLQPITVLNVGDGTFELLFGERRWRSAARAGLEKIPAIVKNSVEDAKEIAIIENELREQLTPEDFALAIKEIKDDEGCTQEVLAEKFKKSRPMIAKYLKIAEFTETGDVYSKLLNLRKEGAEIGLEILYSAACKPSVQEAFNFLKVTLNNHIPTMTARNNKITGDWDALKGAKMLKAFRTKLDFSYLAKIPAGQEIMRKEIDSTIVKLKSAVAELEQQLQRQEVQIESEP